MFDSPRRRRRRRIIWPVLITAVAIVAVLVATAGGDARATISYVEEIRSSTLALSRAGSTLTDLVGDLAHVDRSEFESVVMGVEEALDGAAAVAAMEVPEQTLVGASMLFRLAVESWTQGIGEFSDAVLLAADEPTDPTAPDDLAAALVDVRSGDRVYSALLDELARDDVPAPVGEMPDVQLLPVDAPITVLVPAWVIAARVEGSGLALRPSIRIEQVRTSPEWVTSADESVVIPATDTIDLAVVVSNTGNIDSEPATVELTLADQVAEPVVVSEAVPAIAPGMSTSVIFTDLAVVPAQSYQIQLLLTPGGPDAFADDNRFSTAFTINAPTDTTGG